MRSTTAIDSFGRCRSRWLTDGVSVKAARCHDIDVDWWRWVSKGKRYIEAFSRQSKKLRTVPITILCAGDTFHNPCQRIKPSGRTAGLSFASHSAYVLSLSVPKDEAAALGKLRTPSRLHGQCFAPTKLCLKGTYCYSRVCDTIPPVGKSL